MRHEDFSHGVARLVAGPIRDEIAAAVPQPAPAQPARTVTINVVVDDPEPGHWCETCLLPSAFEAPLHALYEGGVIDLGRLRACPDCCQIRRA